MVMSEVSLCRIEELLLGPARELRPALAIRDPAMLSLVEGHFSHWVDATDGVPTLGHRPLLVVRGPR